MSSRTPIRSSVLSAAPVEARALDTLRARFHGGVLVAGDQTFDDVRRVWNQMVDRQPALIAQCTGAADVRTALDFARSEGLDVTVRCGGHSIVGHGVADGALLIDLAPMRGVRVDPGARRAWVQGGARLRDLDRETLPFGLGVPVGAVGDTGVGGLALGGGYGFATRRYGLTCDNLVACEIVTADGELLVVDESRDPDLLWGLRGGGGNFGVVVGMTFRTHPLGPIAYGDHLFPVEDGIGPLRALLDLLRDGPDEVIASAAVGPAPAADWVPEEWHGRPTAMVSWVYHGPIDEGRVMCASLAAPADPSRQPRPRRRTPRCRRSATSCPARSAAGTGRAPWPPPAGRRARDDPRPGCRAGRAAAQLRGRAVRARGSVRPGRRARHRVRPPRLTLRHPRHLRVDRPGRRRAPAGRGPRAGGADRAVRQRRLRQQPRGRVGPRRPSAYGGQVHDRLTALKDRLDPTNVFHHNQNVRPTGAGEVPPRAAAPSGGRKAHRDAEAPVSPRGEGEGSVVGSGDALDDRQAEPDTCVVGADAFGAALKRLDKSGHQLGESLSPVFSTVSTTLRG